VVKAGAFDFRPIALGGRVVEGEGEPVGIGHEGLERRVGEASGHKVGLFAGGGDGRVGGPEVVGNASGAQPTGNGASADGENGAKEEADETRGGTTVEKIGQMGKPLAGSGVGRA
jgi:hypothetical protein